MQAPPRTLAGYVLIGAAELVLLGSLWFLIVLVARLLGGHLRGTPALVVAAALSLVPPLAQLAVPWPGSAGAAPAAPADAARPSVLLLTIDTLRQDHVGAYGGKVPTPNLDALAARGTLFQDAYCQAPLTTPSHASLLHGLIPPRHGSRYNGVPATADGGLARILASHGYRTAAFVSSSVLTAAMSGLAPGFAVYDETMLPHFPNQQLYLCTPARIAARAAGIVFPERRAAATIERARAFLAAEAGRGPLFLWVHLYDPHMPYDPPARFAREADPGYRGSFEVDRTSVVDLREGRIRPTAEDLEHGRRLYGAEVAYVDHCLGPLLADVSASGRPFLVVVAADHGESLGEHGYTFFHGENLHWPSMRVPLLMAGPGIPGGRKVPGLVRLVDVAPTLLDILGLPAAPARDGRSLSAVVRGGGTVPALTSYGEDGDRLYIAPKAGRVSLEHKDLSLRTPSLCYVIRPATGAEELYDLASDPAEARSVAADPAHATLKAALRAELMAATDFASYMPGGAGVPMGDDEEMRKTLQQLGYIGGDAPPPATAPAVPAPRSEPGR